MKPGRRLLQGLALTASIALHAGAGLATTAAPPKIVLIGGSGSEAPGLHAYADGVKQMAAWLQAWSRGPHGQRLVIESHPNGWPHDSRAFNGTSTLVLYCDGDGRHPLLDAARHQQFDALMRRGVGLVALHQASTVPVDDSSIGLLRWLGAERRGLFDRTTETTMLQPAAPAHPVTRGVQAFTLRDEFYPTLRFAAQGVVPVLTAKLHVQFRDGRNIVDDLPEHRTVAWVYQRADGGRAFGYTGAHALQTLQQPMLQRTLLNAMLWTAGVATNAVPTPTATPNAATAASPDDVTHFQLDAARSGWQPRERTLTPAVVAAPGFGALWESPPFDTVDGLPPRLYASPLFVQRLRVSAGQHQGQVFSAVFAASSNGEVRAVNAAKAGDIAPGRVLWRTRLAPPCRLQPAPLDGVATGVLSTPVIDVARQRLYVTHCDPAQRRQAYALDLGSGAVLPGWPVRLDEAALNAVNRNAGPQPVPPKRRFDFRVQRGALNLSPDGTRLYVTFGESETGWLVSVDTVAARIHSAFAASAMPHRGSGGIWGAGGPAVDDAGYVHVVTGSGFDGYLAQPNDWTQSPLRLADGADGLRLVGSYTPFNHCSSARMDIDLGSGGVALLPRQAGAIGGNQQLLVIGGKQGNAYLLDGQRLPGRLDRRPDCATDTTRDAANDGSLLPPERQPQFAGRGPLNVFGPYSEEDGALDIARARSLPAAMRDAQGRLVVFMTGNARAAAGSAQAVPPSLVRLAVHGEGGPAAHLRLERSNGTVVFGNPGSPVVSSRGPEAAIVWVLDENARRSALLAGTDAPRPVLYAFDASSLQLLWQSAPGALHTSGKYNAPLVVNGQVIVGTDRLQAFGPGATPVPAPAPAAAATTDAATLFQQRCAACHDQPQGNVPPRSLLARRTPAQITEALTQGVMRPQATGLTPQQIDALARHLSMQATP